MSPVKHSVPTSQWPGILLVVVGAFCFSLAIPFTRWTAGLNTSTIAFFRALFGFLFLALLVIRWREPVQFAQYRDVMPRLVLLGVVVSLTVLQYTYAVQHTSAANAAILVNSAPIYVALLAPLLLGEPRAPLTWISIGIACVGMVLLADPRSLHIDSSEMGGLLAGAGSGLTYGVVMLISRSLRGRVTGLTQNLWSNGIIVIITLPWALQADAGAVLDNVHVLIPLGVFSLGLSYWLYFLGLARVSAQVVSIASLSEPVFGVLMGLLFFAEVPNALGWIGGVLILSSVILISRPPQRRRVLP
ncbi:MAG: EamA family transporter [Anaerolineae bacterium]|nr:EamA family transporter [Anaerolineae bacterium]